MNDYLDEVEILDDVDIDDVEIELDVDKLKSKRCIIVRICLKMFKPMQLLEKAVDCC